MIHQVERKNGIDCHSDYRNRNVMIVKREAALLN